MTATTSLSGDALKRLKEVVKLPTAPFREELVQEYVLWVAQEHGLEARSDRHGNIRLDYRGTPEGDAGDDTLPSLAFVAHMDHPGFIVTEFDNTTRAGKAEFRGWIPRESMANAELRIYDRGELLKGVALEPLPETERGVFPQFRFRVPKGELEEAGGALGTFDVPFATTKGDRLLTKSADNLAQVALLLSWLVECRAEKRACHAIGLFTRAEEVGFVGASALLETGLLPGEETPLIVLECSKQLPGLAEIGSGPVVRVGDAGVVYDPDVDSWMWRTVRGMQRAHDEEADADNDQPPAQDRLAVQRALMTGGVCEAGLFALVRRRVGALALPLLNYHNIDDNGRPAPEIISLHDAAHQLRLMNRLATEPFSGLADGPLRESIRGLYDKNGDRLAGSRYAKKHIAAR